MDGVRGIGKSAFGVAWRWRIVLLTCDNEDAAPRWWNTGEPLTHPSGTSREGLEVNSTQEQRCSVPGCIRLRGVMDLCRAHYNRKWKHGDVQAHIPLRAPMTTAERFWSKVDATGVCWEWTGAISKGLGYGSFYVSEGRWAGAHRAAYEMLVGDIPDGLQLDHLCRNTKCVNPDHLEPVTPAENSRRSSSAATSRLAAESRVACGRGHLYTTETTYIDPQGYRVCRACRRITAAARRSRLAPAPTPSVTEPLETK